MKSILITGATGYFGQGMVKHLLALPDEAVYRICIYSRDEAKQATMRAALPDPDQRLRWFIGDVRDKERLCRAMEGIDLVMHAAALKRVEVGEYCPEEMVKTNVLGSMNVIEAANQAGVKRVVALSSDKACQPINAYGASKLMMEKLMLGANNGRGVNGPLFIVTRYGNVAGSTGSVISNWRAAMRNNPMGEVTITDPNATRFWMTVQQAIDLVLRAGTQVLPSPLLIPELPAYRLGDLAAAMHVKGWNVVGLGTGEKLNERMQEDGPDSSQVRRMTIEELREALKSV